MKIKAAIIGFFFGVAAMAAMEAQAHVYYFLLKQLLRAMLHPRQYSEQMFPEGGVHQFILELDADTLEEFAGRLGERGVTVFSERVSERVVEYVQDAVDEIVQQHVQHVQHENEDENDDDGPPDPTPLHSAVAGGQQAADDLHQHAEQVFLEIGDQFAGGIIVLERNFDVNFPMNYLAMTPADLDDLDAADFDDADEQVQILLGHAYGHGHGPNVNVNDVQEAGYNEHVETGARILVKFIASEDAPEEAYPFPYLIVPGLGHTRCHVEHGRASAYLQAALAISEEMLILLQDFFLKGVADSLGEEEEEIKLLYKQFEEVLQSLSPPPPPGLYFYNLNDMNEWLQQNVDEGSKEAFKNLMVNPPENLHKLYYAGCETQLLKHWIEKELEKLEEQELEEPLEEQEQQLQPPPLFFELQNAAELQNEDEDEDEDEHEDEDEDEDEEIQNQQIQNPGGGKWTAAGLSSLALFCIVAIAMIFWSLDKQRKAARKGASFPNGYKNCLGSVDINRSTNTIH